MNASVIGSEEGSFVFLVDEHCRKITKVGMARFKNGKFEREKRSCP